MASTISFLAIRASRSPFWTMFTIRRNSVERGTGIAAISEISERMRSTDRLPWPQRQPISCRPWPCWQASRHPVRCRYSFPEMPARHLVPLCQPQHLTAQRRQPAVERIELVHQKFDLVGVKLHAFDQRGQFFAQVVIFFLDAGKSSPAAKLPCGCSAIWRIS